jgi:hypothetical protein
LNDLHQLQGELKSLTESDYHKLRGRIEKTGFRFPVFVWSDDEKKTHIIDGHQRIRCLLQMEREGFKIPKIPVADIEAESLQDAREQILAACSAYGVIESDGLYEFMNTSDISIEAIDTEFRLPDIDMDKFREEFFGGPPADSDEKEDDSPKEPKTCPHCGELLS